MVVLFIGLCVVAGAASAAPQATPAASPSATPSPASTARLSRWQQRQAELLRDSAPADEYFGKMKMSYLGMNNTFRDAAISSGDHTIDPGIVNKVTFAEDALDAWANKYPRDPQLARTYFLATVVERKIWIKSNQEHAWTYLNRLVQLFPGTYFGKLLKADLAIGFTEHYYELPVPCATSSPTPPPADEGIDAFYVPPMLAVPNAPTPTPTPLPSVTPMPLAKGLSVVVLPQYCVPVLATPSPSPSPSPVPSATAASTTTATPAATATPTSTSTPAIVPAPAATRSP